MIFHSQSITFWNGSPMVTNVVLVVLVVGILVVIRFSIP